MVRSSSPAARELLLFLIPCKTISGEKRDTEFSSNFHLDCLLTIKVDGSLEWRTVEVNCLAKAIVISPLRVSDLVEKVMGWLGGILARFPLRDFSMPHRREGLHLIYVGMIQRFGSSFVD